MTFANPLIIFALEMEARDHFDDYERLFTGVGKVNASYTLMNYLRDNPPPDLLINLGTAGSATFNTGEVVQCRRFIQRDMDVTPLGFEKYQTPFSDMPPVLKVDGPELDISQATCGTGDHFDTAHTGEEYDVVDMEAYALAHIAHHETIPLLCLKYISDGADGQAHEDWEQALEAGANALKQTLVKIL